MKRLKLIYNGKPFCHLCLQDVRGIQTFKFECPFGNIRGRKGKVADNAKDWTLRFEIEDVYEGDKYDDTAISEIYFDGWDVH